DAQCDELFGELAGMVRGARAGRRGRGATGNAAPGGGAESGSQVRRGGGGGPGGGHGAAVRRDRERRTCGRDRAAAATGRPPGPDRAGCSIEMGIHTGDARRRAGGRGCPFRDTLPSGPATETEAATATMKRQNLIIDADDTLWENNIYFERAFEEFVAFLDHSSMSPREVRDILDEMERVNARIHGYGSVNFGRNLRQGYEHPGERENPDGGDSGGAGDAQLPGGTARSHAIHQGARGRTEAQDRPLRPGRVLPAHGDRERERCGGVPAAGGRAGDGRGGHVDDRQQSEIGRESGAGGGAERGVRAA